MGDEGRFTITQDCKHPGHYGHIRDTQGGGIAIADLHHGTHARAAEMVDEANNAAALRLALEEARRENAAAENEAAMLLAAIRETLKGQEETKKLLDELKIQIDKR